jgi:5-methyltetrahydrofolate--homocysteine methyltransferase
MTIDFSTHKWDKIKDDTKLWWQGKLGRPIIQVRLHGKVADRDKPSLDFYPFTSFYNKNISAAEIVDCWDYYLSQTLFLGDAYPCIFPNFGPGVVAAFIGAELINGQDTVWFHLPDNSQLNEIELQYDIQNYWFCRLKDIVKKADEYFNGLVQIAMTDLGGGLDILSSLRHTQKLLYDFYDYPSVVKHKLWKINELWFRYFDELTSCTPGNPGYSNWALIFSDLPSYILQCDFSYMLGPDMFREFVLPELKLTSSKLKNTFYHLDGPGQLVHLDAILNIDEIKGIQWIPGAGQPYITQWPDVFKRISDAGKKIQIFGSQSSNLYDTLDVIEKQTGRIDNVIYIIEDSISNQTKIEKFLKQYIGD